MKNMHILGGVLVLASMAAEAQVPAFEALDTDANGLISTEEASQSETVMAVFDKADVDQDGNLSPAEYKLILPS